MSMCKWTTAALTALLLRSTLGWWSWWYSRISRVFDWSMAPLRWLSHSCTSFEFRTMSRNKVTWSLQTFVVGSATDCFFRFFSWAVRSNSAKESDSVRSIGNSQSKASNPKQNMILGLRIPHVQIARFSVHRASPRAWWTNEYAVILRREKELVTPKGFMQPGKRFFVLRANHRPEIATPISYKIKINQKGRSADANDYSSR